MAGGLTRRDFFKVGAAVGAAGALSLVQGPIILGAGAKSQNLRCAVIGCGGRGQSHLAAAGTEQVVALANVDEGHMAKALQFLGDP